MLVITHIHIATTTADTLMAIRDAAKSSLCMLIRRTTQIIVQWMIQLTLTQLIHVQDRADLSTTAS
jgi:hypothetical protein